MNLYKLTENYGILNKIIKMITILKVGSTCALLDEGKTRRCNRIGQEKYKLAKNCNTRNTRIAVEDID